jgi:ATP-dependent Clp protease ATP-binding subunit ClpC
MNNTLVNELPTTSLSIEHFLLSILQNKNCKAYIALDESLSSFTLDGIHDIMYDILKQKSLLAVKPSQKIIFDNKLQNVYDKSVDECKQLGDSLLTTEHVLLSILKDDNRIKDAFLASGLNYEMFYNKIKTLRETKNNNEDGNTNNENTTKPMETVTAQAIPKLKKTKTNNIDSYCTDLNKLAENNKIDKVIGREKEINQIIKILSRRKKNNTILVGEGGVGKTALAGALALMIQEGNVPSSLLKKKIVSLDITAMIAGTQLRGMFEERIKGLIDELKANKDEFILFIDDIHNVFGNGSKTGDVDISSMMSSAMENGDIQVIGTTTFKGYKNSIESNSSLARKFQKITIEPTNSEQTYEILDNIKKYYEDFHGVQYTKETIKSCIDLSTKYITDRCQPDSAIDILDICGSHVKLDNEPLELRELRKKIIEIKKNRLEAINEDNYEKVDQCTAEENKTKLELIEKEKNNKKKKREDRAIVAPTVVYDIISEKTGVPVSKLNSDEKKKLSNINNILKESIIGQDEAVDKVCRVIKRSRVGLGNPNRPNGVYFFIGGSGCGKTLLAKQLAKEIFGDEKYLIRLDMSEYGDKTSINKLIGSNAGYVGFEEGSAFLNKIKQQPYSLVLFDEFEKADNQIYTALLQLFDEGYMTDNMSQKIDFKNTIIVMTSNIGVKMANEMGDGIGYNTGSNKNNRKYILEKELKKQFPPEFINRIDDIVYFNSLTDDNLKSIVCLELSKLMKRVEEIGHSMVYGEEVIEHLFNLVKEHKETGARPIIYIIQDEIENKLTDLLIDNDYENHCFVISVVYKELKIV